MMSNSVALFDVDGTLISLKSMVSFLQFCSKSEQNVLISANEALEELSSLYHSGASRERLNQAYYRLYKGCSWQQLMQLGEDWFKTLPEDMFYQPVLKHVKQHQAQQREVIIVSGSFLPCLNPIARQLGITQIICASMGGAEDDCLTGETDITVIGEGKRTATLAYLADREIDWQQSYAYGDDISDLPMLELVGQPHIIGDDKALKKIGQRRGWQNIAVPH